MESQLAEFADRIDGILRRKNNLLENLFHSETIVEKPYRSVRLHILKTDGNGRPQTQLLTQRLTDCVLDYCIPRKMLKEAFEHFQESNSASKLVALSTAARRLFTDISQSGEGGELLLFILTESILGYPQIVSKMSLKTSTRMHIHGLDGIYVSCQPEAEQLRLHFGESKLRADPNSSVRHATEDIAPMLKDRGFLGPARQDFFLIETQSDLGDDRLENALLSFLDPDDEEYHPPESCAVLLAGCQLEDYPTIYEPESEEVRNFGQAMASTLESAASKCEIGEYHIDMFAVPFENLDDFRASLLKELNLP